MYRLVSMIMAGGLLGASAAFGQGLGLTVDYHNDSLIVTWTKGPPNDDGMATKFLILCGPASQQYTYPVKELTPVETSATTREASIPIKEVVPAQGQSYCTAKAANKYGESRTASAEVPFDAGSAPTAPALSVKKR